MKLSMIADLLWEWYRRSYKYPIRVLLWKFFCYYSLIYFFPILSLFFPPDNNRRERELCLQYIQLQPYLTIN